MILYVIHNNKIVHVISPLQTVYYPIYAVYCSHLTTYYTLSILNRLSDTRALLRVAGRMYYIDMV